jgi:hypothetical protein
MKEIREKLFNDYLIVADGATVTNGTDFDSKEFDLADSIGSSIMLHVKGTTLLATGNVEFVFSFYEWVEGETPGWAWVDSDPYTITLDKLNDVCFAFIIPSEAKKVKLTSITNVAGDGSDVICNAAITKLCFNNLEQADTLISSLKAILNG